VGLALASSLELLLDDAGGHIHPGTKWIEAPDACSQAGHKGGFHHNGGVHHGEHFAVWNFTISKDGCYWVEEYHPDTSACGFSLSSKVPVQIDFCRGKHTAGLVDQSTRAGQWNKLSRLPFYTSHSAAIRISSKGFTSFQASGTWAADAFRLRWDAQSCHDEKAEADEATEPAATPEQAGEEQAAIKEATPVVEEKQLTVPQKTLAKPATELPLLQAMVDSVDAKIFGRSWAESTKPVPQCQATAGKTFRHDGLDKARLAKATYLFDPPRDGCYLVEERHPQLEQCKASANTKVHAAYCRGLEAGGTVNQTATAGQWTFLAALPFYAGFQGSVTLSNSETEPGTLAIFDQVRFTWSAASCRMSHAHPRQAEIRINVDFASVDGRHSEFASALKGKLAELAKVPVDMLRVTNLRPGSIIAEILVLPSVVDDSFSTSPSASETMDRLLGAISGNAAEVCALTNAAVEGCSVEFKDLGIAKGSVRPIPKPKRSPEKQQQEDRRENSWVSIILIVGAFAIVKTFFLVWLCRRKASKARPTAETFGIVVVTPSMEEGNLSEKQKTVDEESATKQKTMEEESDNNSTVTPSSDRQSECSINGDSEVHPEPSPTVVFT